MSIKSWLIYALQHDGKTYAVGTTSTEWGQRLAGYKWAEKNGHGQVVNGLRSLGLRMSDMQMMVLDHLTGTKTEATRLEERYSKQLRATGQPILSSYDGQSPNTPTSRQCHTFPSHHADKILADIQADPHVSLAELAERYGCLPISISALLNYNLGWTKTHRWGEWHPIVGFQPSLSTQSRPFQHASEANIVDFLLSRPTQTVREVAEHFGVTSPVVYGVIIRNNIEKVRVVRNKPKQWVKQ